jgi:hypothetical protein
LFGEEFADFLDPAFNTSKYDELEIRYEQQKKISGKGVGVVNRRPTIKNLRIKAINDAKIGNKEAYLNLPGQKNII